MSSKGKSSTEAGGASGLVPKLRFPEFQESPAWEAVSLRKASVPVDERVGERKLTPVSISAGIGFVPQAEKFGRDISGNQYQLYTLVRDGDFVFNKGNSLKFPQGCIYLLQGWGQVAAPNVFIAFRLKDGYSNSFFQNCFEQNQHGRQLKKHITSGARSNGLLNISKETFFDVEIPVPGPSEQQKIADCLDSADALIAAQGRKVEALKAHKKGLMQQLFPRPERIENGLKIPAETQPRLRFPEFKGSGAWREAKLQTACNMQAGKFVAASEIQERSGSGLFPCYGGNGLRGYTVTSTHSGRYPLIGRQGALCGNVRFAEGKFHATEHAVVASPKEGILVDWLFYVLNHLDLNQYATGQAQPGLSVDVLNSVTISISPYEDEQQRIADCLTSLEDLITAEAQKLDTLKTHKKGLMQMLFPSFAEIDS
ncbi:restriction endonuclease subunit S [Rhodobacter sp. KR11]|uniref:restriction endonuclease subunit S n=1 Tax=Rhodobacter sp. KR11 TaxID=2974588 RepID=UPI00222201D2|nr:restriction endonuclease subunit S [Rhodobacter sp. KR11]MCW1920882.1 restriction endonuclease subunit S [Rhodobacter sp. KR11]